MFTFHQLCPDQTYQNLSTLVAKRIATCRDFVPRGECECEPIKKRRRCDRSIDRQKKVVPARPRWRRLWAMLSLARLAASERTGISGEVSSSTSSYRSSGSSTSPRVSQMLCRTQQAPSTTGRSWSFTSVPF
uniref:Uncharacterized protein n=1 Tax=Oryza brachyantha TaxID=4533 RepID=J3L1D0_ORYBR